MTARLDPVLKRAVANAWRDRGHWGDYSLDAFLKLLATELERERNNEARRHESIAQESSDENGRGDDGALSAARFAH